MEANHCLNTKNMISKVESVAQSSRVLKKFQVSSIMKISSSDETFEIEKFTSSKERTNINNATQEHSDCNSTSSQTAENVPCNQNNSSVYTKEDSGVGKTERQGLNTARNRSERDRLDIQLYMDSSDAEYWDQEQYLSEHNYEELLDIESAKTFLNFGDDYRNFIESNNSEVQTPRFNNALKLKKSSAKVQQQTSALSASESDSNDEIEDIFVIISHLKEDVAKYENQYKSSRVKGFKDTEYQEYLDSVNEKCELSLKFLNSLQGDYNSDGENDFIRRKQQRELRFLQNRWKQVMNQVKKDMKLKEVFEKLKDDISNLSEELGLLKNQIRDSETSHFQNSRKHIRFLKDCQIKLTRMKPKLFEKNLTVHKLYGDVSDDVFEVRYLEVDKLKDEVVELYQVWDSCMNLVSQYLLRAEDYEKNSQNIESGLDNLSSFLRQESKKLLVAATNTDSGVSTFSDSSEGLVRHESWCVKAINMKGVRRTGARLDRVNSALLESRKQLKQLKSILSSASTPSRRPRSRSRRVISWWSLLTCLLLLMLVVVVVFMRPRCCDHINQSYFFLVQYSGGARPI